MSTTNNLIFTGVQIASWIIFIGLSIEAGTLILNFIFSLTMPEYQGELYKQLDLSEMYQQNKWAFFGMYSFVISIAILKAHLFYIVVNLVRKLDLKHPFNTFVSNQITRIAYYTVSIGVFSHIARQSAKNMQKYGYHIDTLNQFWVDSQAFILMSAVIYLISVIFKKGVEIQQENDLTV